MRRSGKEWYRNEREVMESLGLTQVPGSGNGWVSKEDGENEHVLCQLKSTDAQSIKVSKLDMDKLRLNAMVSRKLPVFAIQFMGSGELYLVLKPSELREAAEYLESGRCTRERKQGHSRRDLRPTGANKKVIRSAENSREAYNDELKAKYRKKERSAI